MNAVILAIAIAAPNGDRIDVVEAKAGINGRHKDVATNFGEAWRSPSVRAIASSRCAGRTSPWPKRRSRFKPASARKSQSADKTRESEGNLILATDACSFRSKWQSFLMRKNGVSRLEFPLR